jgi:ubiquinone biosynthesis protein
MMISHFIELSDPDASFDPKTFEDVIAAEISPLMGLSLEKVQLGNLFWKLARAAAQNGAPMPRQLLVFVKTLSTFEAIGKKLDPDLDIIEIFQEFGAELSQKLYSRDQLERQALIIGRDLASLARHGPRQIRQLLGQLHAGDLKITVNTPDLDATRITFERVMIRLALALLGSSLLLGSSILVLARVDGGFSAMPHVAIIGFVGAAFLAAYTFLNPFGK